MTDPEIAIKKPCVMELEPGKSYLVKQASVEVPAVVRDLRYRIDIHTMHREQTGALGDMLEAISDFYDEELDTRMAAVLSLVEPVLLVLMASVAVAAVPPPSFLLPFLSFAWEPPFVISINVAPSRCKLDAREKGIAEKAKSSSLRPPSFGFLHTAPAT